MISKNICYFVILYIVIFTWLKVQIYATHRVKYRVSMLKKSPCFYMCVCVCMYNDIARSQQITGPLEVWQKKTFCPKSPVIILNVTNLSNPVRVRDNVRREFFFPSRAATSFGSCRVYIIRIYSYT